MNAPAFPKASYAGALCGCGSGMPAAACDCTGCGVCQTQVYVRPYFFAGQLLTEDDLQSLNDYVTGKNRLHNRYLMGAGVVCGFDVACPPCGGGTVTVHPGYALDCCGNDLVLQCTIELDINAMVRDLRRSRLGDYDCGDPCAATSREERKSKGDAAAGRQENHKKPESIGRDYCLYARYCESMTDPVTPYASDEQCGQAECRPTRIREGLRFELRCREEDAVPKDFLHRIIGCFGDLTSGETLAVRMANIKNPDYLHREGLELTKKMLIERLDRSPGLTDCTLRAGVASIALPPPKNPQAPPGDTSDAALAAAAENAADKLVDAYVRYLLECFCAAINPPCLPCDDTGVLLACVKVQDCEVVDICNLERNFVLIAPAFRYWIPTYLLSEALEAICCTDVLCRREKQESLRDVEKMQPGPEAVAAHAANAQGPWQIINLLLRRLRKSALDTANISEPQAVQLGRILGSLAALVRQGAFDHIFPFSELPGKSALGAWMGRAEVQNARSQDALRTSVASLVDEVVAGKIDKQLQDSRTIGELQERCAELMTKCKELEERGAALEEKVAQKHDKPDGKRGPK